MIYMDHNATTPMEPEVIEAMTPYFSKSFGNASSAHQMGVEARNAVEAARQIVAKAIGAKAREVIFTSGGTEADNMAIHAWSWYSPVLVSSVEHDAILKSCACRKGQAVMRRIPLDRLGSLDLEWLECEMKRFCHFRGEPLYVYLISVMHVNNETGNVMDVRAITKLAKKYGAAVHTDAVQSFGKTPVKVDDLGVDMLSLSAHKIYGPKGIGALYVRDGIELKPLIRGGYQERNLRAGTENVAGIVGFGKAVEIAMRDLNRNALHVRCLLGPLYDIIDGNIAGAQFNTQRLDSIGNTLNVAFDGVDGEALVLMLDQRGICVSRGAACEAGVPEPSHVLKAMGRTDEEADGAIRISLGRGNSMAQVVEVADALREIVGELRGMSA